MALTATIDMATLPAFPAADLPLWNWQAAFLPGVAHWQPWFCQAAAQLLREPRIASAQLVRTASAELNEAPQVITLDGVQPLRIGRAPENEVVLPQVTVTRQHAELRWQGDALRLVDLGSSLGTVVNGVKAQPNVPIELNDGAEFVIFPYRFQVKLVREWIPVQQVEITHAHQAIRTQAEFLADHSRGWSQFLLRAHASPDQICLALEDSLLLPLTERLLALPGGAQFALPASQRVWHELLVLGALAEANRSLLPAGFLTLSDGAGAADSAARGIEYRAVLELAGVRGAVACFLPFHMVAALSERWFGASQPHLASQVTLALPVSCGRVELSLGEQRGLEPGDVILYQPAAALLFPGGGRGWKMEPAGETQFAIKEKLERSVFMTDRAEVLTDITSLSLNVEIVLGHKEMSIRDAEALAPGAVIGLERQPHDPVQLAVNGRVIGTGQLVSVDGRWGVRIVEWCGGQA